MRKILNISLPQPTAKAVRERAKKYGFESISEYVRFLLDMDTDLISAKDLLTISKRADREYASGRIKKLHSLADLL